MKRVLIAMLAALLAVSAGVALASGHHHGGHGYRAAAGCCHWTECGYCHKDGACAHDGVTCHFHANEDGDGVCDRCGTHWTSENVEFCGHNYVDEDGDGVCDHCPAPQMARFAGHHGCCR